MTDWRQLFPEVPPEAWTEVPAGTPYVYARQPVPGVYEGQPRNGDEWAARGVTWTREVPPLPGYYWWRSDPLSMPEPVRLEANGEWWAFTNAEREDARYNPAGLWWPVPLVTPPVTALSPS
jgi:hypothetical protein